jgi:two-component system response regulator AtoC
MMELKIAVVEDNPMYAELVKTALESNGFRVECFSKGQDLLEHINEEYDLISLDYSLEGENGVDVLKEIFKFNKYMPVILLSGQTDVEVVVEAYDLGVSRYIIKDDNAISKLVKSAQELAEKLKDRRELALYREEVPDRSKYPRIIGQSNAILSVLKLIDRVAPTDTLVMITGESGTGKEVVAQSIHENSRRKKKPFVAINMAAIPDDLMEAELFGHERGAFTGAGSRRKGKFEEAQGGTIFLDEIGEITGKLQTKLLRVLQEKKISRLGSNKEINLDVRIIAATNKNLSKLVKEGKFRDDLYYRIQGFLIHLPSLSERGNDIKVLTNYFLDQYSKKKGGIPIQMSEKAHDKMHAHHWRGNVRELISVIERSLLMKSGNTIQDRDIIFSEM